MENPDVPVEMYWSGKLEPISPVTSSSPNNFFHNSELFDDDFANEIYSRNLYELQSGIDFSHDLERCDDLVDLLNLKEEQIHDLELGSSTHLPNYCNRLLAISPVSKIHAELDTDIYDTTILDTTSLTQLTPPQSPPHILSNVNCQINHVKNETSSISPVRVDTSINSSDHFEYYTWNATNAVVVNSKFVEEIERETQIVDDIVNTRAQELINWNDDSVSTSSISSPSLHSSTDEECVSYLLPNNSSSISPSSIHVFEKTGPKETNNLISIPKKRTRPYGRGVEDRKIRKKEQNKNAATRYRQKKKQELEDIISEEQELGKRNESLQRMLADRIQEAKYLKTLIQEFYRKKKL